MDREKPSVDFTSTNDRARTLVVVGIVLFIALIHLFRVGTYLRGPFFTLYYSYFSDIAIPFGVYFLVSLNGVRARLLEDWRVKALLVFGAASSAEVLQAFGVPFLGRTFDPLDFAMFGAGVLLAVLVERLFLDRLFPRRSRGTAGASDAAP